jgi:hypothetical protein
MSGDFVSITLKEYADLHQDRRLLQALQDAGVDNWDGYDEALELSKEDND